MYSMLKRADSAFLCVMELELPLVASWLMELVASRSKKYNHVSSETEKLCSNKKIFATCTVVNASMHYINKK